MNVAPPRFDMYTIIHKALRAWTAEVAAALGRLDPADATECADVFAQLEAWLDTMADHLRHEDEFVHAALAARGVATAGAIADEHVHHRAAIADLRRQLAAAMQSNGALRTTRVLQLYRALWVFAAESALHMHEEETVQQPLLERVFSDAELIDIHDRLVASIPPAKMAALLTHILPALNPYERAGMLAGMQQNAPRPVFDAALAVARATLTPRNMDKLLAAIAPLPLAA